MARTSSKISELAGSPPALFAAGALVGVWLASGPKFQWSDTWHLLINSPTTIITFLMTFVILNTQNRSDRALHSKVDAVLEAVDPDDDDLVGIEDEPEKRIKARQQQVRDQTEG